MKVPLYILSLVFLGCGSSVPLEFYNSDFENFYENHIKKIINARGENSITYFSFGDAESHVIIGHSSYCYKIGVNDFAFYDRGVLIIISDIHKFNQHLKTTSNNTPLDLSMFDECDSTLYNYEPILSVFKLSSAAANL